MYRGLEKTLVIALLSLAALPGWVAARQAAQPEAPAVQVLQQQDTEVRARLEWTFSQIEELAGVQVEVTGGVARLAGEAASWEARELAEQIASRTPGVILVENRVAASREVETRLAPAIEKAEQYFREFVATLPLLLLALLVLGVALLASRLAARSERLFRGFSANPFVQVRLRQLLQLAIVLAGLLLTLEILGITAIVGAVLGTAGIAGIVLGFAFKDIVENYLAGLLLSLRQPFAANDHVRIGEHEGKVVRLTARETILMTLDGNHVRLPNSSVFTGVMLNFTRNPRRRFSFSVGVGVGEDLTRVQEVGLDTLRKMEGVLDTPAPGCLIQNLGDSNVNVLFLGWVDQRQADFGKVRSEAIRLVKAAFDGAGISMPEPTYVVRTEAAPAEAPERAPAPAEKAVDVSVDDSLDRQIEEDRQASPEDNLLDPSAVE